MIPTILTYLYFHGPALNGYGFWDSKPIQEICVLAGHIGDCDEYVNHRAEKFRNTVYILVMAYLIYTVIRMSMMYLFVIMPLTRLKQPPGNKVITTTTKSKQN